MSIHYCVGVDLLQLVSLFCLCHRESVWPQQTLWSPGPWDKTAVYQVPHLQGNRKDTHSHTQTHTLTHLASPYHSSKHNNSFWPHFLLPVCACVDEISGIKRTPCLTVCPCDNCVLHFSPGVEHLRGVYFPWCFNNSGRRLQASLCSDTQLHCPLITRDTLRSSLKSGY